MKHGYLTMCVAGLGLGFFLAKMIMYAIAKKGEVYDR